MLTVIPSGLEAEALMFCGCLPIRWFMGGWSMNGSDVVLGLAVLLNVWLLLAISGFWG
jgi:hypothetical protein